MAIPKGWYIDAHKLWSEGRRLEAVQKAIAHVNTFGIEKPISLVLQLAYYFYLLNDYRSAATIL